MIEFPSMSRKDINSLGEKILDHFQPGVIKGKEPLDVDNLIELIEDVMEIDFDITSDLPPGVHGCTSTTDNKVLILSELADNPYSLKYFRSTVTHEIGHTILHLPLLRKLNQDKTFSQKKNEADASNLYSHKPVPAYKDPEWQAWELAGSLLMPAPALRIQLNKGATIQEMADFFNVNHKFVESRMKKLKML